ncbi:MAG: type III-B CRISPR module RAMP protein Cmr1 [Synergistaceae bacterium]|nr:type III-B CRISPR module RAMP protein Cmr1 [Synergistaceae bacterium]
MRSITARLDKKHISASPPTVSAASRPFTDTFTLETITPMTGGGYEAGHVDRARPVRVPAIRGHLRYWFRMLGLDGEAELFGSTDKAGKISADVPAFVLPPESPPQYTPSSLEGYALFPVLKTMNEAVFSKGLKFRLSLTYPEEYTRKVRLAVSAWVYFGGIGARTRRGCGSLRCVDGALLPLSEVMKCCTGITLWTKKADAKTAWTGALKSYRAYRKGTGDMREASQWPEARSIKDVKNHRTDRLLAPKAALGMPINFDKFGVILGTRDSRDKDNPGRMASPVITKALRTSEGWFSAVIFLPVTDEVFTKPLKAKGLTGADIPDRRGAIYSSIPPMKGELDAISGFVTHIDREGYKKYE